MNGRNSLPAAIEQDDAEAVIYARDLAVDRYLPLQAQIHQKYIDKRPVAYKSELVEELRAAWVRTLSLAMAETQALRNPVIVARLLAQADIDALALYPDPVQKDAAAPADPSQKDAPAPPAPGGPGKR